MNKDIFSTDNGYESLRFLQMAFPDGPWCLTAIPPNGGRTYTETFYPNGEEEVLMFLEKHNSRNNLYYHSNPVKRRMTKKAKRDDIDPVVRLHADIDPRTGENLEQEQKRILNLLSSTTAVPRPSTIIFSGGGYQTLWDLVEEDWIFIQSPKHIEEAETRNIYLAEKLGGDSCHDISRLLRLPGSYNIPSEKKKKRGRTIQKSKVVFQSGKKYRLSDFPCSTKAGRSQKSPVRTERVEQASQITNAYLQKLPISNRAKKIIVLGHDPNWPGKYPSRSEAQWSVSCELVRAGVPDSVHKSILLDPRLGISECILDKPNPDEYADRQIQGAHDVR